MDAYKSALINETRRSEDKLLRASGRKHREDNILRARAELRRRKIDIRKRMRELCSFR